MPPKFAELENMPDHCSLLSWCKMFSVKSWELGWEIRFCWPKTQILLCRIVVHLPRNSMHTSSQGCVWLWNLRCGQPGLLPVNACWRIFFSPPFFQPLRRLRKRGGGNIGPKLRDEIHRFRHPNRLYRLRGEKLRLVVLPGFSLLCWATALRLPRFAQLWPAPSACFLVLASTFKPKHSIQWWFIYLHLP